MNAQKGDKFGRWTLLEFVDHTRKNRSRWLMRCHCGTERVVGLRNALYGKSNDCGCGRRITLGNVRRKHGQTHSSTYNSWSAMKTRCLNPNEKQWKDYGGRGILVCDRWINSFENFLLDMGERPTPRHSLGRINNDGPYSPENCRWETTSQQLRNKRDNHFLTFGGETKIICDWARDIGSNHSKLSRRIKRGWSVEKTLNTP